MIVKPLPADYRLPEGVATTTGGTFDRNAPPPYFIASSAEMLSQQQMCEHVLIAVNEVRTARDIERLDRLCDERKVLLDSGIYNLAMTHARKHQTSHDVGLAMPPEEIDGFDRLWDLYGKVATRFADRLWGVIELDQGGVEHKPRTRARIETEFGVTPMPVYHPLLDGWDYYDALASHYDRMCVGNLVKGSPAVRIRLMHTVAERARAYPYLWTHLLGVTPNATMLAMPMRGSSDSSSWTAGARWSHSWMTFAMLQAVSHVPSTMWYSPGGGDASHEKAINLMALNAANVSRTLGAVSADTHGETA